MDEATIQRLSAITKMESGGYHPGCAKALAEIYKKFGLADIVKIEEKKLTYLEVYLLYNDECGRNIDLMHGKLNS